MIEGRPPGQRPGGQQVAQQLVKSRRPSPSTAASIGRVGERAFHDPVHSTRAGVAPEDLFQQAVALDPDIQHTDGVRVSDRQRVNAGGSSSVVASSFSSATRSWRGLKPWGQSASWGSVFRTSSSLSFWASQNAGGTSWYLKPWVACPVFDG